VIQNSLQFTVFKAGFHFSIKPCQRLTPFQLCSLLPPRAGPWTSQQMGAVLLPLPSQKEAFYCILLVFRDGGGKQGQRRREGMSYNRQHGSVAAIVTWKKEKHRAWFGLAACERRFAVWRWLRYRARPQRICVW